MIFIKKYNLYLITKIIKIAIQPIKIYKKIIKTVLLVQKKNQWTHKIFKYKTDYQEDITKVQTDRYILVKNNQQNNFKKNLMMCFKNLTKYMIKMIKTKIIFKDN